jgi:hypothetical protein
MVHFAQMMGLGHLPHSHENHRPLWGEHLIEQWLLTMEHERISGPQYPCSLRSSSERRPIIRFWIRKLLVALDLRFEWVKARLISKLLHFFEILFAHFVEVHV